jgi:hypothetical protein
MNCFGGQHDLSTLALFAQKRLPSEDSCATDSLNPFWSSL